eukprot:4550927-Pleurochrysis_carterae.AAC.2
MQGTDGRSGRPVAFMQQRVEGGHEAANKMHGFETRMIVDEYQQGRIGSRCVECVQKDRRYPRV